MVLNGEGIKSEWNWIDAYYTHLQNEPAARQTALQIKLDAVQLKLLNNIDDNPSQFKVVFWLAMNSRRILIFLLPIAVLQGEIKL